MATTKRMTTTTSPRIAPSHWTLASAAVLAALALALLAAPAGPAEAHAYYDRSEPADGEVLTESPDEVHIWFTQELARREGLPSVIIVNQFGDQVDRGAELSDDDRRHITVQMPPAMPDGRYTVIWHNLSDEDGDEAQGAFHFYVGEGPSNGEPAPTPPPTDTTPPPESTPEPAPAPGDDDSSGVSAWLVVVGLVAGLVAGGGAGVLFGRRMGGQS